MSTRKKVSVILCVVFLLITSLISIVANILVSTGHPGLKSAAFAPANVIGVSDEKDIMVTVYPAGLMHHAGKKNLHEVNLNCIKKGWLVDSYNGKCRLIFDVKNADMEDFGHFTDSEHYYIAEIIPKQRLWITDLTARHADEPTDPFADDYWGDYASCCIATEVGRYSRPRVTIIKLIAVNAGFIALVAGVNVIANKVSKHKKM